MGKMQKMLFIALLTPCCNALKGKRITVIRNVIPPRPVRLTSRGGLHPKDGSLCDVVFDTVAVSHGLQQAQSLDRSWRTPDG